MYVKNMLAISGLISIVASIPMAAQHQHHPAHDKRVYIWETVTQEVIVTVPVTKTVWIEPGQTPPIQEPQAAPTVSSTPEALLAANTPATSLASPIAPASTPENIPAVSSAAAIPVAPTTSVVVPPAPTTTSVQVAPVVSSTPIAAASSAAPSAPAAHGAASNNIAQGLSAGMAKAGTSYTGDLTYYTPGLGACGITSSDNDAIVAVSKDIFDLYTPSGNPNHNPLCGKYVTIDGAGGQSYQAKIVDRCVGCAAADLDLSPDFFNTVTKDGNGRVHNMKWSFD